MSVVPASSGQLRFFPHSTYNQSFFLLRVNSLTFNDQPAQISSENRHLTLGCCNPPVSITFDRLITEVDAVVNKYGLGGVSNYWCEDVPLFELKLSSEEDLRRFLRSAEKVRNELASRIAAILTQQQQNLSDPIAVYACAEVFMLTPLPESKDARVIRVTSENLATCTTIWRESEVFSFESLFQALKTDCKGIPNQGKVTLAQLDLELHEVHEWFVLGVHLGIPPAQLHCIRHNFTLCTPLECRVEMLSAWMKLLPGPSWSRVVQALMTIGRESLAHEIALKYGVQVPALVEKKLDTSSQMSTPFQQELSTRVDKLRKEVEMKDKELDQKNHALEEARRQKYAIKQRLIQTEQTIRQTRGKTLKLIQEKVEVRKQLGLRERELQSLYKRHQDSEKLQKIIRNKEEEVQELQQKHTQMKLIQEKMEIEKQLLLKEQELQVLRSHEDSEKLQSIIRNKEEEMRELQRRLHTVESELTSERKVTQDLKEKLHLVTAELAEKSALAQEREKANRDLKTQLEKERQRIDHLFMQLTSASNSRDQYISEVEHQLSTAKLESVNSAEQIKQHKVLIDQREEEIKSLSQQIQEREALIRELEQESARTRDSSTERQLELEEHILKVADEAAGLRDKLEEAKEESQEAAREIGAAQVENELLQGWMTELRTETHALNLRWTRHNDMPFAMSRTRSVVVQGMVCVGGGEADTDEDRCTVMVYDQRGGWSRLPRYHARYFGMAVLNNQLILAGGQDTFNYKTTNWLTVWDTQQWTYPYPPMHTPRESPALVTYNKWLVVAGGYDGGSYLTTVEIMDGNNKQWFSAAPLPVGCTDMTSAIIEDEFYLMGGDPASKQTLSGSLSNIASQVATSTNKTSRTLWNTLPDTPFESSAALAIHGLLLAVGGTNDNLTRSSAIHVYKPESEKWVKIGDLPTRRSSCTCTLLPSGNILVAGGYDSNANRSSQVDVATVL